MTSPTAAESSSSGSSIWDNMDTRIQNAGTSEGAAINEMDNYLADGRPPRNSDPYEYWRNKASIYPRLCILVKVYHCVLMNSVPCERVFSKMGQIITVRRNRLSVQKSCKLGMIAENVSSLMEH